MCAISHRRKSASDVRDSQTFAQAIQSPSAWHKLWCTSDAQRSAPQVKPRPMQWLEAAMNNEPRQRQSAAEVDLRSRSGMLWDSLQSAMSQAGGAWAVVCRGRQSGAVDAQLEKPLPQL